MDKCRQRSSGEFGCLCLETSPQNRRLGPWGEQLLIRLKWNAFSLYDVGSHKVGCPHTGCIHLTEVDIYHVFWTCPSAEKLRGQLTKPWMKAGVPAGHFKRALFSLSLPQVPAGIRKKAESMFEHNSSILFIEAVTTLVDHCWRLGAVLYFHAVWR